MKPPTTFTQRGRHVVTITTAAHGASLSHDEKLFCALSIARNSLTHERACESIIAHGLAADPAEADALIFEAEGRE